MRTLPSTQAIAAFGILAGAGAAYGSWKFGKEIHGRNVAVVDLALGIFLAVLGGYIGASLLTRSAVPSSST